MRLRKETKHRRDGNQETIWEVLAQVSRRWGVWTQKLLGKSMEQGMVTNGTCWWSQTEGLATVVQVPDLRHLSKLKGGPAYPRGQS